MRIVVVRVAIEDKDDLAADINVAVLIFVIVKSRILGDDTVTGKRNMCVRYRTVGGEPYRFYPHTVITVHRECEFISTFRHLDAGHIRELLPEAGLAAAIPSARF